MGDDADDPFAELRDAVAQRDARGECIHCGTPIDQVKQHGRCIYAEPCGHRLGQGDAKIFNRNLARLRRGSR